MTNVIIGREYPKIVTPLIEQAQHSLDILVFDWRWYAHEPNSRIQKFNQAVVNASLRGVKVTALVNNNIVPTILQLSKLKVRRVGTKNLMHVKMVLIDKKILVLGSHNLTQRAFEVNHEVSLIIDDARVIGRLLIYFENLCLL